MKKKNFRMLIEYDGTNFYGWQCQPKKRTVQGELKSALKRITNETVSIIGAGRTDRGVHAVGQVANFFSSSNLTGEQLRKGINSLTPEDVYIKRIELVEDDFNSRFSAKSKVYCYYIISEPLPCKIRYNWFVKYHLDLSAMKKTIPYILGRHDFKNFSVGNGNNNSVCEIYDMNLTKSDLQIIIKFEADRFLWKMVRGIVGFMVDVGRGRFSPDETKDVFAGNLKDLYFAPPQGLFLVKVSYPCA